MPKEKPTPLLGRKKLLYWCDSLPSFLQKVIFSTNYLFPTSVNIRQFRSLVAVLKKKWYKWYLTKYFF